MRKWIAVGAVLTGAVWLAIACQRQMPDAPSAVAGNGGNGTVTAMDNPPTAPSNMPVPTNPSPGFPPTQPSPFPIEGNPSPQPSSSPGGGGQPGGGGGGGGPSPSPSPCTPSAGNIPVNVTFTSATGRTYEVVASAPASLQPFTDRTWTYDTGTDPLFRAATFLRTPDDDTPETIDPLVTVSFTSTCPVTVLVFYPLQMSTDQTILAWLEDREGFSWSGRAVPDVVAADLGTTFLYGMDFKDFGTSGSMRLGPIGISVRNPRHMYFVAFSTTAQ